jgi:heptosyltransferase-1
MREGAMGEQRFLVVRLGSLGDIVHTLPAVHALRTKFPEAQIDWLVESKWRALLADNPDLNEVIALDRSTLGEISACVRGLRRRKYDCAIDFQGLYKSAVLARLSGAPRRIGFAHEFLRESGASWFYTESARPTAGHVVDMNLSIPQSLGAEKIPACFPISIDSTAEREIQLQLESQNVKKFFVMSPGGGWMGKCWPAEQYGNLHRRLMSLPEFAGWRGVVNFGPGERELAEAVRMAAGEPAPALLSTDLPQLIALLRRAEFFVGGDTGPLHLAVALGTPVIGLYGPTDPVRNGPYSPADIVVHNARPEETTYKRDATPAPSMLSITVEQVVSAIQKRLGACE